MPESLVEPRQSVGINADTFHYGFLTARTAAILSRYCEKESVSEVSPQEKEVLIIALAFVDAIISGKNFFDKKFPLPKSMKEGIRDLEVYEYAIETLQFLRSLPSVSQNEELEPLFEKVRNSLRVLLSQSPVGSTFSDDIRNAKDFFEVISNILLTYARNQYISR